LRAPPLRRDPPAPLLLGVGGRLGRGELQRRAVPAVGHVEFLELVRHPLEPGADRGGQRGAVRLRGARRLRRALLRLLQVGAARRELHLDLPPLVPLEVLLPAQVALQRLRQARERGLLPLGAAALALGALAEEETHLLGHVLVGRAVGEDAPQRLRQVLLGGVPPLGGRPRRLVVVQAGQPFGRALAGPAPVLLQRLQPERGALVGQLRRRTAELVALALVRLLPAAQPVQFQRARVRLRLET